MQVKTFIISVSSNQNSENELNLFLRSNKIFNLEKDFVANGINSYWAVFLLNMNITTGFVLSSVVRLIKRTYLIHLSRY